MTAVSTNHIDASTALLTATAAAVATGDLETHAELAAQALSQGMPPQVVMMTAMVGNAVRQRPAAHMMEVADVLTGSSYVEDAEHVCPASQLDSSTDAYYTLMQVSAGAAMAANCEPCLNQVVPTLLELGASFEELQELVAIGKQVKDAWNAKLARRSAQLPPVGLSGSAREAA